MRQFYDWKNESKKPPLKAWQVWLMYAVAVIVVLALNGLGLWLQVLFIRWAVGQ